MLQSLPHHITPSPARLGLSNPTSPALQSPSTTKSTSQASQSHQSLPQTSLATPKPTSSTLLSLLPPLPRAQALLAQMASLSTKLFDVSPNRSAWLNAFRGSLPTFLSSQVQSTSIPLIDSSAFNSKEIISLFTSLQTQLFEAVAELQEILDLEESKQKLNREIEAKDAAILSFAKKLKEAERVLDILVDDYADYRRPKRTKLEEADNSSGITTVASQLKLSDVISYAHKISYTTFAPPEFGAGGPLRGALPPAPQEDQMRASQLYAFADLDVGLPKTVDDKEKTIEPLIQTPAPPETDPMAVMKGLMPPPGWKPGMPVELPMDIPLPPPGWKPGDPVPLPPLMPAPRPPRDAVRQPPPIDVPSYLRPPETIQVDPINIDIFADLGGSMDDEDTTDSSEGSSDDDED